MAVATLRRMKPSQTNGPSEAKEIVGTVERRRFHNPQNSYCVLIVRPRGAKSDLDADVTVTGYIPDVREGNEYRFKGKWERHPKHGEQLVVQEHELLLPTTQQGVIRYLADVATGVGPVIARKIVETMGGEQCLEQIKTDPSCLRNLPFLRPGQAEQIIDNLAKNQTQAELSALICGHGVTPKLAAKVFKCFGADSVKVVKENPYVLADQIEGIGFLTADKVAQAIGIAADSPFRVKAAVNYLLKEAGHEGHCYLRPRDILAQAHKLLDLKVEVDLVAGAVDELIAADKATREGNAVYAATLHAAECQLAARVRELLQEDPPEVRGLDDLVRQVESQAYVEYAPEQREAVRQALSRRLSIVTGGPGTGKTTVVKAICEGYEALYPGNLLFLASPTGRAAQRMTEATGQEAQTIHRLLRYNPVYHRFEYNLENPLPSPGLLIVDEFSMCDVSLARDLFAAIRPGKHQVVLVGDIDQLPSVEPGSVLRDLISCGLIPVTRLRFNYRQAGGSKIAEYANLLAQGIAPPSASAGDYEYIYVGDDVTAAAEVLRVVKEALASGLGVMDLQVLSPMHKTKAGVAALNRAIRDLANPYTSSAPALGQFRLNDKIMVIRNNYNLGVFNGNMGRVTGISEGVLTADIDGQEVQFAGEDLELLTLAYAATVHKAQGSEFRLVIMPLLRHHYVMLQRNLLYTGMTRARERLVLISDGFGVWKATENDKVEQRFSLLAERIRQDSGESV